MDTTALAAQNYRLLSMLNLLGADGDQRLFQQYGLSAARFYLLGHLEAHGSLTATDLCHLLLCDKANVTRLINGLEKEGLVIRQPDKTDGRRTFITSTVSGKKRWAQAAKAHQTLNQNRFKHLTAEESQVLEKLLARLKTDWQNLLVEA